MSAINGFVDSDLSHYKVTQANNNALIAIDAPFAIPSMLKNKSEHEEIYELSQEYITQKQLQNPYIFDNSARFIYNKTQLKVLEPCASWIGSLTARMIQIIDSEYRKQELKFLKTPIKISSEEILAIEVYPKATLKKILDKDVPSYKSNNWKAKKNDMLELLGNYKIQIPKDLEIKTDDDYDAIICALTAYLVDKNGYEKPNEEDYQKFTNSFIYDTKNMKLD